MKYKAKIYAHGGRGIVIEAPNRIEAMRLATIEADKYYKEWGQISIELKQLSGNKEEVDNDNTQR